MKAEILYMEKRENFWKLHFEVLLKGKLFIVLHNFPTSVACQCLSHAYSFLLFPAITSSLQCVSVYIFFSPILRAFIQELIISIEEFNIFVLTVMLDRKQPNEAFKQIF